MSDNIPYELATAPSYECLRDIIEKMPEVIAILEPILTAHGCELQGCFVVRQKDDPLIAEFQFNARLDKLDPNAYFNG